MPKRSPTTPAPPTTDRPGPQRPRPDKLKGPSLGRCCICLGEVKVRTFIHLHRRAHMPGTGWGCLVCDLPLDGAIAVACDACCEKYGEKVPSALQWICLGRVGEDRRISYSPTEPVSPKDHFDHDRALHTELWVCGKCGCMNDTPCLGKNGTPCYWITATLCSACATQGQQEAFKEEINKLRLSKRIDIVRWIFNRQP